MSQKNWSSSGREIISGAGTRLYPLCAHFSPPPASPVVVALPTIYKDGTVVKSMSLSQYLLKLSSRPAINLLGDGGQVTQSLRVSFSASVRWW